jgi:hypothetical protein
MTTELTKEVFITYSTDEWQSLDSYQLEGISSSLENARKVVVDIFHNLGCNIKAVIQSTKIDGHEFCDIEIYDYDEGLEWKTQDEDYITKDFGYLKASKRGLK